MNRWFLIHFGNFSEWTDKMFVLVILLWKCIPNFCEWGPALCDCHMLPSLFPLFLECLATPNMVGETTVVFAQWMLLLDFCKNMFCCCCLVAKSRLTLLWPPLNCRPPGFSVHGISQARILEWIAISFSRGSSRLRDWIHISCIGRQVLDHWATREELCFTSFLSLIDYAKDFNSVDHNKLWKILKEIGIGDLASPSQWTWVWIRLWELVIDREAWHAAVHGAARSWTWLSEWTEASLLCILTVAWSICSLLF